MIAGLEKGTFSDRDADLYSVDIYDIIANMNNYSSPIDLYDILVEQGVEKDRARKAVDVYITREEARLSLATKADIRQLIMWMVGLHIASLGVILTMINTAF